MPPPRKIDLLPPELRRWLQEALVARGFADYEALAEDLNWRLEEAGSEIRIQKSALNEYGVEFREFVRIQEQSSDWAKEWMTDVGMEDQAQRQNVLFQMITALAFKMMHAEMGKEGKDISPQGLHFLARVMKDVMSSSSITQAIREKIRKEDLEKIQRAEASGDIRADVAAEARRIMGFTE
jgi:hypothetical protein